MKNREAAFTLAATVLGSGLVFLEQTSVNVILPILQREFDTGVRSVQWVFEGYMLFLASLLLAGGALGDRFGRRRVFMIGAVGFAAASLSCGLAPNVEWLIGSRMAQGVAAALLVPGSLALITATHARKERGRAFGVWAAATGFAAAGGPLLGGFLADAYSWRLVFLVTVPIALGVFALLFGVPESKDPEAGRLDFVGAALATAGFGALTFGLVEASALTLRHPLVLAAILGGVAVLAAFVWWESRAKSPMVPLDIFRNPAFSGTNAATLLIYASLSGALFFVPFNLIQLQGWSPTAAGAAILPIALIVTVLSRPAGRIADRIGGRWPMIGGSVVAGAGYALLARPGLDASYWTGFLPAFVLVGLGMAAIVAPLTATVMSAAPERRAGTASGVNNAVARIAGLLAVAVLGFVAVQVFAAALPDDTRDALGSDVTRLAEAEPPESIEDDAAFRASVDAAFLRAFRVIALVFSALCVAAAVIVAFTVRHGTGDGEVGEPR